MTNEVVDGRNAPRWLTPVWVRLNDGSPEAVHGPAEALEKLMFRWPPRRGRHYRSARTSCLAAVNRQMAQDLAREAFIRASLEAKLLD
ncbi:hypothetical protein ASD54_16630 [Rhizobium sp. Root149]|uniref:DUF982 domain-containing protein n=1 Tax=Rhizobium rhizoryzae TaxID=451876 RepID=A0A7W6LH41_9HYPH|nr:MULTISPECIES: DUF982 domain-containing protein [Rhizobium]KQZ48492.1 hypothetical protein ASD54_16630 [Rhizobium sp. Root149]MBB4144258.1 hypothetical protein [Rhizobium rhizoryzae]